MDVRIYITILIYIQFIHYIYDFYILFRYMIYIYIQYLYIYYYILFMYTPGQKYYTALKNKQKDIV